MVLSFIPIARNHVHFTKHTHGDCVHGNSSITCTLGLLTKLCAAPLADRMYIIEKLIFLLSVH